MPHTQPTEQTPDQLPYYLLRLQQAGIPPELNQVTAKHPAAEPPITPVTMPIFDKAKDSDDMIIRYPGLDGYFITYDNGTKNQPLRLYKRTRLKDPKQVKDAEGKLQEQKYAQPKGSGQHPFFTPGLIGKYQKKEKIKVLHCVEGELKAFKGYVEGLDFLGLPSIHGFYENGEQKGKLHSSIEQLIRVCQVEKVVFLTDADTLTVSLDPLDSGKDLFKRPNLFYSAVKNFRSALDPLIDDDTCQLQQVYFMHIKREYVGTGKGFDDLLANHQADKTDILRDLSQRQHATKFFAGQDLTDANYKRLKRYFGLTDKVQDFYQVYIEDIKNKSFTYRQNLYQVGTEGEIIKKAKLDHALDFVDEKCDQDGRLKEILIDYRKLVNVWKHLGFARYDLEVNKSSVYIRIEKKVISEVQVKDITDTFIDQLPQLNYDKFNNLTAEMLINKFYKSLSTYFKPDLLNRMRLENPVEINQDTKTESFFYYKNGFVRCAADGWKLHDYSELNKYLWKNQILQRDFNPVPVTEQTLLISSDQDHQVNREVGGNFADFVFKVAMQDPERFKSLCSILGYNLHTYTAQKLKATVLTDSKISEVADGRTGKTLLCKALGHMRNYCEINGKDFDPDDKHKYQQASIDTQIVHINDAKKNFDIECLFNDITEGIKIERKNKDPLVIQVKMILSTNKTIQIEGSSARDRTLEFEFSDYFSDRHSPEHEYRQWFFSDWSADEWAQYDNFMMYCTQLYLSIGVYQVKSVNLEARKLRDQTSSDFVAFMTDPDEPVQFNQLYEKKELFKKFVERFEDWGKDPRFKQARFTKWLKIWAQYAPGFSPLDPEDETRSNGKDYVTFRSADFDRAKHRKELKGELEFSRPALPVPERRETDLI